MVHGGLGKQNDLEVIKKINRKNPNFNELSIINDLIWADPMENGGFYSSPRGMSQLFGPDITEEFLKKNNLELIIRSHQFKKIGYSSHHNQKLYTVFSCPNYR